MLRDQTQQRLYIKIQAVIKTFARATFLENAMSTEQATNTSKKPFAQENIYEYSFLDFNHLQS